MSEQEVKRILVRKAQRGFNACLEDAPKTCEHGKTIPSTVWELLVTLGVVRRVEDQPGAEAVYEVKCVNEHSALITERDRLREENQALKEVIEAAGVLLYKMIPGTGSFSLDAEAIRKVHEDCLRSVAGSAALKEVKP